MYKANIENTNAWQCWADPNLFQWFTLFCLLSATYFVNAIYYAQENKTHEISWFGDNHGSSDLEESTISWDSCLLNTPFHTSNDDM